MYRVWLRWVALPEFARDECLSCQSQPSLFRAKESPLKKRNHSARNVLWIFWYPWGEKVASCRLEACSWSQLFEKKTIFCLHFSWDVHLVTPCLVDWLRFSQSVSLLATKGKSLQNVYSNLYSQAVTHPSTNRSQPCLTSVIGRELVYSRWYGRRHPSQQKILIQ